MYKNNQTIKIIVDDEQIHVTINVIKTLCDNFSWESCDRYLKQQQKEGKGKNITHKQTLTVNIV